VGVEGGGTDMLCPTLSGHSLGRRLTLIWEFFIGHGRSCFSAKLRVGWLLLFALGRTAIAVGSQSALLGGHVRCWGWKINVCTLKRVCVGDEWSG